jgi:hypothetical protein
MEVDFTRRGSTLLQAGSTLLQAGSTLLQAGSMHQQGSASPRRIQQALAGYSQLLPRIDFHCFVVYNSNLATKAPPNNS